MTSPRIALALVSSVIIACTVACSSEPEQTPRRASVAQALGTDDGGAPACAHPICATGEALSSTCDPCTTQLCAQDPYCCSTSWDATCVGEVASICGQTCAPAPEPDGGASTCAHPICATGAALANNCEPCATQLCAQDPYCCAVEWDATCVGEVGSICGQSCN